MARSAGALSQYVKSHSLDDIEKRYQIWIFEHRNFFHVIARLPGIAALLLLM